MDTLQTEEYLRSSINGIIETCNQIYEILNRSADADTVRAFASDHGIDLADYIEDLSDLDQMDGSDSVTDGVCGDLESVAMDAREDMLLSVDDSHIWFTLGGPNISANVTGWRILDQHSVDVQDIVMKGRWGYAEVDIPLWRGDSLFDRLSEVFEHNLLSKFGAM